MSDGSLKWNVQCNTIVVFAHRVPCSIPACPSTARLPIFFFTSLPPHPFFNIYTAARTVREIENETFTFNVRRFWQIIEWEWKRGKRRRRRRRTRRRKRRRRRRRGKKGRPNRMTLILERGVIATLLSRCKDEKHTMSKCLLIVYRSLSVGASNPTTCRTLTF